jgi:hypothetical protein
LLQQYDGRIRPFRGPEIRGSADRYLSTLISIQVVAGSWAWPHVNTQNECFVCHKLSHRAQAGFALERGVL